MQMKKILLITLLTIPFLSITAQIPKDSLKAAFRFNGNADDESGNGNNATVNGTDVTLTTDRSNNANSAYNFDGANGDISADIGEIKDELSISFWYSSATQVQPYPHFFDYGDYRVRCHLMSGNIYNTTDRNAILLESYNPSATEIRGSKKPGENKWTHVVVSFSKSANELKLYVDGTLDKQASVSNMPLSLNDGIIVFGRVRSGSPSSINTTRFKGKLDDIFIYNKILTQTEITALYNGDNVASNSSIEEKNFSVYPNPFSNELSITLPNAKKGVISYSLSDVTGKNISKGIYTSPISTDELSKGVYLLSIYEGETFVGTKKVLKK